MEDSYENRRGRTDDNRVADRTRLRARTGKGGKHSGSSDQTSDEQKKKNADADKAYKSAIQSIPDKKSDKSDDPWQKVR
jgi:general stress protein YciG